ncbi:V-type proton ATPase subunit S1 [Columba livia]|uniref:ATPase, H+ transporting, lysosomal accessory protein 1 n=1 Tax=Columba livia TaxID=8932 RepID=A0A2I0MJN1_COLLI|nr:V-type proton ATPase subunit S1 [Columba livia]PKK29885.1 ATPase, H+ transporting, lysosomal accessory protein 1 [Columba livia]
MRQLSPAAPAPLLCALAVLLRTALSVDHVPMLLWSTQRSQWNPDATLHEGHIVSAQELTVLLQPVFTQNSRNLILFLQDTLSIDDFTYLSESYGNKNPFQNIQEMLQSSPSSLVLPAVDCKAIRYLLSFLQESGDWKLTHTTNLNFSQLELDTSKPNLLVVQLRPLVSGLNEISIQEAIAENDKIIGRLTMDLQERGIHFSVIYTAARPSRISRRTDVVWELRRQLMATEDEDSLSYPPLNMTTGNETCILFYASNFSLTANGSVPIDLTNATFVTRNVDISSSECSDANTTLSLKYTNPVNGISSLEIRFLMTKKFYTGSARYWSTLDSVEIVQDGEKFAKFNVSVISAPAEYSFHCQLVGTDNLYPARLIPNNDEAQKWDVFISRLQIQGFNIENNQFSYASDCTGFFTPGIWMGLVTSIILVWILTYGIHMIMQLTTNSRFDDPKGPALSVPQTE